MSNKRIGLALGSGGAKGFAHIGALQVLEEHNIKFDVITGCSFGAIVGGLYSAGVSPYFMEEWAKDLKLSHIVDIGMPDGLGFVKGNRAEKVLRQVLTEASCPHSFEACKIKFGCVATDILAAKPFYITKGDLVEAIRASISIPLVFKPVEWEDKLLMDGGPLTRLPVKLTRKLGADIVIGIDCVGPTAKITKEEVKGLSESFTRILFISEYANSKAEIATADYLININQPNVSSGNLKGIKESILAGRREMEKFLATYEKVIFAD